MRLTTKFSAFVTLLTSLTIFVTLIGASLSFYNGIQLKMTNRVQAVATMLDNRLVSMSFDQIEPQMDELMTPIDATRVDFQLNGKSVYSHSRTDNYRPLGSSNQFRDITVPSLKQPGMAIHLVYLDPMASYFRSLHITAPLSIAIGFMVLIIFFRALDPSPAGGPGATGTSHCAYSKWRTRTAGSRVGTRVASEYQ